MAPEDQKPTETSPPDESTQRFAEMEAKLKAAEEEKATLEQQLQDASEFSLPDDNDADAQLAQRTEAAEQRLQALEERATKADHRALVAETALKHQSVPRSLLDKAETEEEMSAIAKAFDEAVSARAQDMSKGIIETKDAELAAALGQPLPGNAPAPLSDDLRKRLAEIELKGGDDSLEEMSRAIVTSGMRAAA